MRDTNVRSQPVPELLAPAGGREQFFAALNAGADAVYLGLKAFNARARAENFTEADLSELVPLAHRYGMKVLVTLNVLVKNTELTALITTLAALEALEVDAIIVQDVAVASIACRYFPHLRLHASTQMAVHNLAGVRQAQALGFRRVVLARELTATEMRRIRAAMPRSEVELEAFCHGSLCYSYSGLCFFSGAEDARSGNRGECAYTCRQPYKIVSEPGHGFLFSMRDLDTAASLESLVSAGIDTLKIEGRKKDAQYVASTVSLYRQRLDEVFGFSTLRRTATPEAIAHSSGLAARRDAIQTDLSLSFQRRPTALFLQGRYHENVIDLDNPTHAGILVGKITAVVGRRVTVSTACELERFDGLRLSSSAKVYHSQPQDGTQVLSSTSEMVDKYQHKNGQTIEFSLRDFSIRGQRATTAQAGLTVEIALPPDLLKPQVGDSLYKIRSADLKRRVDHLAVMPRDAKTRKLALIDIELAVVPTAEVLTLRATAFKFADPVASAEIAVPLAESRGESSLEKDVVSIFSLFGDQGFRAKSVVLSGMQSWFVPRAQLKALKNTLGEALITAYAEYLDARRQHALTSINGTAVAHPDVVNDLDAAPTPATLRVAAPPLTPRYAIKSDRLSSLATAARFAANHSDFCLQELVFEPKRAFLADLHPEALALQLAELAVTAGVPVRLALPTVIRAWDEPLLKRWFAAAYTQGLRQVEIGNLGGLDLLAQWGLSHDLEIASDFTLYALNASAYRFWRAQGLTQICLSIEDDHSNLSSHLNSLSREEVATAQAIIFKDTPLFIAEACSLTALHNGCPSAAVCGYRSLEIENTKGERFIVAHESCKSIVYAKEAYSLTHVQTKFLALGVRNFRIDFLTRPYTDPELTAVLNAARLRQALPATHTANFNRTLL